jgi:hypothetical protein
VSRPRPLLAPLALALAALLPAAPGRAQEGRPVSVEPGDLTRRQDLVGREVEVDDRVARFQYHPDSGFDQIFLKRAPDVSFELPPRLRPAQSPSVVGVKVRGVLRHREGRWWCDVTGFEPQPSDLDRLNRAVSMLSKSDAETRTVWARWAEKRGLAFNDDALLRRAREVEGDAIRAESEKAPRRDPAAYWLALAARARAHQVPEPEPSAQAHRGFRAALAAARSADELKALVDQAASFFPAAKKVPAEAADTTRWEKPYLAAPADAYRAAPADARAVLDHRLWADATQLYLERRAAEDPRSLFTVADEAARLLPDRPKLASDFLEKGVTSTASNVGGLRQSEVETLAKFYNDTLHQPEKATALYRAWLDDQKDRRLSPRDAEGRISLAEQYETLLDDRPTAVALLRDAWKIDPQSREVTDAFRRRGFRKVNGDWVEASRTRVDPDAEPSKPAPGGREGATEPIAAATAPDRPAPARSDSLRGATPDEVRARMGGRPNRKLWVASQGQVIEQWIYFGPRQNQYVNLLHRSSDPQPRVVSYYSLPRSPSDASPAP